MQKNYFNKIFNIRNQDGAALLYILFTVVFIGIVGTGILMNTTYGMKSVEKNEQEQKEFYLAEGALEVFLNELNTLADPNLFFRR